MGIDQKRVQIFYADDDLDDAFFFKNAIREINANYAFASFVSGVALLQEISLDDSHHNIIFLDLNMPQKNGIECLADIRNNGSMGKVPVFIISTSNNEHYKTAAFETGANDYIEKPSSFQTLKLKIKEAIDSTID